VSAELAAAIDKAFERTGVEKKADRGWNWLCYCVVCSGIRAALKKRP
jgi:hypothetical protein